MDGPTFRLGALRWNVIHLSKEDSSTRKKGSTRKCVGFLEGVLDFSLTLCFVNFKGIKVHFYEQRRRFDLTFFTPLCPKISKILNF